ncbi:heavy metal sensor histidine kinase [Spirosoma luteolum]
MSLRSRIVLAVAAVFGLLSGLAVWLMLQRAERSLCTSFDRATRTRANWLVSLVSVEPVVIPLPGSHEQMRLVYTTYGRPQVLFESPDFPAGPSRPGAATPTYRAVTVAQAGRVDGQLRLTLAVPDRSLRQDIRQLQWAFGLSWLISLVLAFGAGYGVAGWLLRPIQRMVQRANTITGAGNMGPIDLPATHDELYQLTAALNGMLARIQANNDLQRNFFGAAAHELRTPLAVMKTGLDVTLSSPRLDDQTGLFLTSQLDEVRRLTRLVDEFLTLSRPDETPVPVQRVPVDLSARLAHCRQLLARVAADYDVSVELLPAPSHEPQLLTDAGKLEHILLNLLENAIKYAVPGSTVRVVCQTDDAWRIRVTNQTDRADGPTLDLLQPYFQADPLREGHGLGLWISHRLTRLLGGHLRLSWHDHTFTSELTLPLTGAADTKDA